MNQKAKHSLQEKQKRETSQVYIAECFNLDKGVAIIDNWSEVDLQKSNKNIDLVTQSDVETSSKVFKGLTRNSQHSFG